MSSRPSTRFRVESLSSFHRRWFVLSVCLLGTLVGVLSLPASQAAGVDQPAGTLTADPQRPSGPRPQTNCPVTRTEGQPSLEARLTDLLVDRSFQDQVWARVGERACLKCHNERGDAADSRFILRDATNSPANAARNFVAFVRMAIEREGDQSRLLVKATGGLDHGGGEAIKRDSTQFRIVKHFACRVDELRPQPTTPADESYLLNEAERVLSVDAALPPLLDGVALLSPEQSLRRVTLSLVGRLPSDQERAAVREGGLAALDQRLDDILKEDDFYVRLKEGFNDIFLTLGYEGSGEDVLAYEYFQPTRLWYQKHDLSSVPENEQQRARWSLADVYRDAIRREPLELIEHIVRNDRPFTELATADYIMVSPYSARGYGVYEDMKDSFTNPDDPFEYHPVRLKALTSRAGKVQESATGYYPHAGFLSMFHYLRRYPTTETNRNRLRARMYYQHFLGIDVMALAPRVTDAAAVSAKYEIPTMQATDCVVCHRTIDPVAGLFQDYNEGGHLGPRKDGWYQDMFGPGFEGDRLAETDRWRALQWLGERTVTDPRFATAMVEHVYYILMGRSVLQPPADIDDPLFSARRRAFQEQRRLITTIAEQFVSAGFNLKTVFKQLALSDLYRVDGRSMLSADPDRLAELDDIGLVRLLTPEQLERQITAVFGRPWGRLVERESRYRILYGGIDSESVTERMTDPSGAMGAIQRIMSNDVACRNVALDFTRPPSERLLFASIEPDVVPGQSADGDKAIHQAIVYLHDRVLGQSHEIDHPEVTRTFNLFAGIISDASATEGLEKRGTYFCERINEQRLNDPHYTLRAWRAVVTYLLRQRDFLYE